MPDIGIIYVLSNPAMPGLLKIGFTQKADMEVRIEELSKSTAVPLPFVLQYEQLVENPAQYERLIHARLAQYRVAPNREFFRTDIDTIGSIIRKVVFGVEDFDAKSEIEQLVNLYRKFPESFTKSDDLIDKLEKLIGNLKK